MDHLIALVPSAGVLLLFVLVVRYFLRADRIEREQMKELDRRAAAHTPREFPGESGTRGS